MERQTVLAGVQPDLQLFQLLFVAGQRQRGVLDGKDFDHHQSLPVFGPGHLEEASAAQTFIVLMVIDIREVTVHRQDLRRGDAGQLVPHPPGGQMSVSSQMNFEPLTCELKINKNLKTQTHTQKSNFSSKC